MSSIYDMKCIWDSYDWDRDLHVWRCLHTSFSHGTSCHSSRRPDDSCIFSWNASWWSSLFYHYYHGNVMTQRYVVDRGRHNPDRVRLRGPDVWWDPARGETEDHVLYWQDLSVERGWHAGGAVVSLPGTHLSRLTHSGLVSFGISIVIVAYNRICALSTELVGSLNCCR